MTRYADGSIEVADHGRGIPVDCNDGEQRYNWELVFCEMYAGGKYKNNEGENYEFSLGLNGLGTCATQYASAITWTSPCCATALNITCILKRAKTRPARKASTKSPSPPAKPAPKSAGSRIWTFSPTSICRRSYFLDTIKRQAVVNNKLKFILRDQQGSKFETEEFCYQNGIVDYVTELAGENPLTSVQFLEAERRGRDRADKPEYRTKLSCAFCFSSAVSRTEYYHNSSWLEYGGAPDKAVRSAFVSAIDGYIKQINKYQKNESKISYQDVLDSLVLVTNCFSTYTSYENQTKKSITNKFIQEAMTDFLKQGLEVYFIENKAEADKIAEQILINKRSREQAEKARLNIKKKLSGNIDVANRVQKFVDCRTKDVSRRELYIVEGDSALGSVKQGRDAEFQAVMPVRGKILNCLKADYNKIFKNDIITDLLKVLGCGVEVQTKASKDMSAFDLASLRWNKVIICTDADVDGFQIRTLILTMLYRLTPTLIEKGYVYIAESPLYEIEYKGKSYFAFDETEKAAILKKLEGKKILIQRSKGLGENEADMMWETTMNPASRRLIQVEPEDAKRTSEMFDLLLGDNLAGRKEYIAENGHEYLDLADIS